MVEEIARILLTAMSPGPEIVTVMLPLSPCPNSSTFMVLPTWMVAPLLLAVPPEFTSETPSTSAFSGGVTAGATTLTSTPVSVCPAATATTPDELAGVVPPPGGVGLGTGVGIGELTEVAGGGVELPPPHPNMKKPMAVKLTSATLRKL
ncbi:MAG: hypothetical protein JWN45_3263 [Acidobacteriaceae bacterium]|nr:hypothetical protein [Acidobacteriaceae bacterium]